MANRLLKRQAQQTRKKLAKVNTTNIAELHIEIMVALDHAILQYHKNVDIENYVLTVFNMVRFWNFCDECLISAYFRRTIYSTMLR